MSASSRLIESVTVEPIGGATLANPMRSCWNSGNAVGSGVVITTTLALGILAWILATAVWMAPSIPALTVLTPFGGVRNSFSRPLDRA